jgi:hypothetical protein
MVNGQTVNCEQVWREISNYVDGDVDAPLRAAMDEHFRTCAKCASVLAGTRNVIRLYSDERMLEAPAGFGGRLERRLSQGARMRERKWPTLATWLVPLAALALFAVGLHWAGVDQSAYHLLSPHAQPGDNIPPDLQVVVSDDSKVFHVASCDLIRGKENLRSMTAKQAREAGYVPCVRCLRKYLQSASVGRSARQADVDDDDLDVAEEKSSQR